MTAPRPTPDPLTIVSFALLGVLAVLLLIPLLTGGAPPSPYLIAGLLLLRLGVQFLRSRRDERLRRPASWAFDLLLIGLIFYVAGNQPG
ncbi:hypothetical protein [Deinococcus humi]|uniref:4-hydroxybenzoate polyprenyltransferase n=1 Tax=Deinococcus humi TaxID=662880 RepID=A0A7W8JSV5_9DEIO|nr:hypothetical protein [Deinococcus humi]MBB5362153.1 4-hydroxybenzoate polyprenyltransferase [Deinococcus humi]GGO21820.1 hypothetical protein GCM10008949_08440 [Deinococcus humi]